MNKKISTFLVGVLLTASAGVFAQNPGHGFEYRTQDVKSHKLLGSTVNKFEENKWYQLAVTVEEPVADDSYAPTFENEEVYNEPNQWQRDYTGATGHWSYNAYGNTNQWTWEPTNMVFYVRTEQGFPGGGEPVFNDERGYWGQMTITPADPQSTVTHKYVWIHTGAEEPAPATEVLVQHRNESTGELSLKVLKSKDAPLNASLWKIKYDADGNSGKNFTLINKETGLSILIDPAKTVKGLENLDVKSVVAEESATVLQGCENKWSWYSTEAQDGAALDAEKFYTYVDKSVYALALNSDGEVVIVNYASAVAGNRINNLINYVKLQPRVPHEIGLNAEAINELVDFKNNGTSFTLDFTNKKPTVANPVDGKAFKAKDVTGTRLVQLESADNTGKFLQVALAFYETQTEPSKANLKLEVEALKGVTGAFDAALMAARSQFEVTFFPFDETLELRVAEGGVAKLSDAAAEAGKTWATATAVDLVDVDVDNAYIRVQNSIASDEVLTAKVKYVDVKNPNGILRTEIRFAGRDFKYVDDLRTRIESGLYYIINAKTGKYMVKNLSGNSQWDAPAADQKYDNMPATQWVFEALTCGNGDVRVVNREYTYDSFEGQFFKKADGTYFVINPNGSYEINIDEEYKIVPVTDKDALENENHGYKKLSTDDLAYTTYKLHYNHEVNKNVYLNVEDAFFKVSEDVSTSYELEEIKSDVEFGYKGDTDLPQLKRTAYAIKVKDKDLINNDNNYIALVEEAGKPTYYKAVKKADLKEDSVQLAVFYLKADQVQGDKKYYVLVDIAGHKVGETLKVAPAQPKWWDAEGIIAELYTYNGNAQLQAGDGVQKASYTNLFNAPNDRSSAFALSVDDRPKYLPVADGEVVKIYRKRGVEGKEFLFEDGHNQSLSPNVKADDSFGFLGVTAEKISPVGKESTTAIYLDSVKSSTAFMPQYLLVLDPDSVKDGKWHNKKGYNVESDCESCVRDYTGYLAGRILVNLQDSTAAKYKFQDYTRLGYVEGVHRVEGDNEYLYIVKAGYTLEGLKEEWGVIHPDSFVNTKIFDQKVLDGKHKNYAFSFRLTEDLEDGLDYNPVLLESNGLGAAIGGFKGGWMKVQNNVPVVAQFTGETANHESEEGLMNELINQAQVVYVATTEEAPVANEDINVTDVKVVAGNGNVTILNAAGKTVAISNILGQTVASQVITSDNTTIAAPKGIVVVAIQGEDAVKAIVK